MFGFILAFAKEVLKSNEQAYTKTVINPLILTTNIHL